MNLPQHRLPNPAATFSINNPGTRKPGQDEPVSRGKSFDPTANPDAFKNSDRPPSSLLDKPGDSRSSVLGPGPPGMEANQDSPSEKPDDSGPRPQFGGPRPEFGQRPPFGQRFGGPRPQFSGPRNEFNGPRNDLRGPRPGFGGQRPPFGQRPDFGGGNQESSGQRQDFRGPRQEFGGPRQEFGGPRQEFGGPRQEFGGNRPPFGPRGDIRGNRPDFHGPRPQPPRPNFNRPERPDFNKQDGSNNFGPSSGGGEFRHQHPGFGGNQPRMNQSDSNASRPDFNSPRPSGPPNSRPLPNSFNNRPLDPEDGVQYFVIHYQF